MLKQASGGRSRRSIWPRHDPILHRSPLTATCLNGHARVATGMHRSINQPIIHSFIHAFMYSFIHVFIHSFFHSLFHPCIHAFMYSFIHSTSRSKGQYELVSWKGWEGVVDGTGRQTGGRRLLVDDAHTMMKKN